MNSKVLHNVRCYISAEAAGEIGIQINLGSARVNLFMAVLLYIAPAFS